MHETPTAGQSSCLRRGYLPSDSACQTHTELMPFPRVIQLHPLMSGPLFGESCSMVQSQAEKHLSQADSCRSLSCQVFL